METFIEKYLTLTTDFKNPSKWFTKELREKRGQEFIEAVTNNSHIVIKKTRQVGITTMLATYVSIYRDKKVLFITTKLSVGNHFTKLVRKFDGTNDIEIVTKISIAENLYKKFDIIIIDEAVFIDKLDQIMIGIESMLNEDGKLIISSTPDETEGYFYDLYTGALKRKNRYYALEINSCMDKNDLDELKLMYGSYINTYRKEVLGEFIEKKKMSLIPCIRIESNILEQIKEKIGFTTISDYVRDLIYEDLNK